MKHKTAKVLIILLMFCTLFTGCGPNKLASEVAEENTEEQKPTLRKVADEFECVYVQTKAGMNHFAIYHHVPTGQMYICYVTYSMVPMGITYEEYISASKAFHAENDTVEQYDKDDKEDLEE